MKNVKSIFGAMILGLVLNSTAFAGDVSTPGFIPPPPPPTAATLEMSEKSAPSDIGSPGFAIQIWIAALSALYQ